MSRKSGRLRSPKNMFFNTSNMGQSTNFSGNPVTNLKHTVTPVQLQRMRYDVNMWREAVGEAERAYYPYRVRMQRMFIDTVLNGHVYSLMERRKDLTLLRDFRIVDAKDEKSDVLTEQIEAIPWLRDFMSYAMDAIFFGYSLISLGDIVEGEIGGVNLVPRWFVSPDRMMVGSFIYSSSGNSFLEDPYAPWHVYVPTSSNDGVSPCGYGLLYQVALYEIFMRNVLGFNGDFVELYAQPYRVGKTNKTSEEDRHDLELAIKNMGSSGWAIIDPMDEISFLETAMAGTGYKSYESLEMRCEKKVSKIILGHEDAVASTPGKLGGGQGAGKDGSASSPVAQAMADKQSKDGRWMEMVINKLLLPKIAALPGQCIIPDGFRFKFDNDSEEEEFRNREDNSNLITAQIAQTMKNAGLQMAPEYFSERTGIDAEKIELPAPVMPGKPDPKEKLKESTKNKLEKLYGTSHR